MIVLIQKLIFEVFHTVNCRRSWLQKKWRYVKVYPDFKIQAPKIKGYWVVKRLILIKYFSWILLSIIIIITFTTRLFSRLKSYEYSRPISYCKYFLHPNVFWLSIVLSYISRDYINLCRRRKRDSVLQVDISFVFSSLQKRNKIFTSK